MSVWNWNIIRFADLLVAVVTLVIIDLVMRLLHRAG